MWHEPSQRIDMHTSARKRVLRSDYWIKPNERASGGSSTQIQAPQQNPWVKRGLESDPSTGVKRAPVG